MMTYVYAFLFCGLVCMIAQLILDNTKLTPGHVTSLFVVIGAFLDIAGIYDRIVLYAGAGALSTNYIFRSLTNPWCYGNRLYLGTTWFSLWHI